MLNKNRFPLFILSCLVVLLGSYSTKLSASTFDQYFPFSPSAKWEYQVNFPNDVSVPYKPWFEEPSGLLCASFCCGMGAWDADTFDFDMTLTELLADSNHTQLWDLSVSDMFVPFYFYQSDTLIHCKLRLTIQDDKAELILLAVLPMGDPNWIIARRLVKLTSEDLNDQFSVSVPAGDFSCVKSTVYLYGSGQYIPNGNFPIEIYLSKNTGIVKIVGRDLQDNILYTVELKNFTSGSTGGIKEVTNTTPDGFWLHQNYPNPFNPATTIRFDVPKASHVTVKIYDILGHEVKTLVNRQYQPGTHAVVWDGRDSSDRSVVSGTYLVRIQAGEFVGVRKMVLMK